ncbi:MAG: hypothetical protein A3A51_01540 [Candidatus Levybacteria bacterium RIFCSPLOWO2_01_FULL_39_10]|nr:MAG: hypothetical protein A3A51_01540 [Candidatus Levybacteria bacterium RIFCSPLOWO2_01_FULL_39_10]
MHRQRLALAAVIAALVIGLAPTATSANGPIPGCPPATHVSPILGPWDNGDWYFPRWSDRDIKPLRLAIVHSWYNLNAEGIFNHPLNPGQPSWGQMEIKTKISPRILRYLGGTKARMIAMGGEVWIYENSSACRHNLRYEFKNGDLPIVRLSVFLDLGLVKVY